MNKEFEYKEEYGWLTNICLNVTDACNLACRYCFVEQHPHYMTLDVAKQAVHFILDNLEKKNKKFNQNKRASITYFGGEPTLMWDEIIVPLTNYIKENNFPIDLTMTTNGTLLNQERIKFLKDNDIFPLLSIDGNRETQEYNRPCHNSNLSSFDLVEKNIDLLLEAFPNITFRSTIYADTVNKTFKNYVFAIERGFKNIYMMPDGRHAWTEEQKDKLCQELDKIFLLNQELFKNNILPINFSSINEMYGRALQLINSKLNIQLNIKRSIQRCGLGITMGAIGWNGNIYGCQEQPSNGIENNIFYIGNLYEGIDAKRHKKLLSKYEEPGVSKCIVSERCDNCLLRPICLGFNCPSSSYDLYNDFLLASEIHCIWNEKMLANCLFSSIQLLTNNNQIFIDYLKRGENKNGR